MEYKLKHKIRALMDNRGDSMYSLAEKLGVTYQTLSKKINGHVEFTLTEVKLMMDIYSLKPEDIVNIFLN